MQGGLRTRPTLPRRARRYHPGQLVVLWAVGAGLLSQLPPAGAVGGSALTAFRRGRHYHHVQRVVPWTVGAGPFTAPSRGRCRWLHFDCGVVDWRRPTPPLSFAFTGDRRRTYTVVCRRSARFVGASAQRGERWTRRLSSPPSHPRYPPRWRQPRQRKCCRPSRSNCWETDPVTAQYTHLDANSFPLQSRSCPPLVGGGWDFRCCLDGGPLLSYVAQLCKSLEP